MGVAVHEQGPESKICVEMQALKGVLGCKTLSPKRCWGVKETRGGLNKQGGGQRNKGGSNKQRGGIQIHKGDIK